MTDRELEQKIAELWEKNPETMQTISNFARREGLLNEAEAQKACVETAIHISGVYQKAVEGIIETYDEMLENAETWLDEAINSGNIKRIALLHVRVDTIRSFLCKLNKLNVKL